MTRARTAEKAADDALAAATKARDAVRNALAATTEATVREALQAVREAANQSDSAEQSTYLADEAADHAEQAAGKADGRVSDNDIRAARGAAAKAKAAAMRAMDAALAALQASTLDSQLPVIPPKPTAPPIVPAPPQTLPPGTRSRVEALRYSRLAAARVALHTAEKVKRLAHEIMNSDQLKVDAGLDNVERSGGPLSNRFTVTRAEDGSTFTVVVVTGQVSGRAPAEVEVLRAGQTAEIRISTRVRLNTLERTVANAVGQASEILRDGARVTDNALDRETHPGDHPTPSVADHGREAEVRHLDRTGQAAARALRRRQIGREMRTLVEHLGMHPDDEVASQRSAVSSVDGIVDQHVRTGDKRPAWALPPNGYPGWKTFYLVQLPADMGPGAVAGWAMLETGASPATVFAVWTTTTVGAVAGTITRRWIGLRDKVRVDKGHGFRNERRAHERAQQRGEMLEPVLKRLHTAGLNSKPPKEPPGPQDPEQKTHHGLKRLFYARGIPPLLGGASTVPYWWLGNLPGWTLLAHVGVSVSAAGFGMLHEKYLRGRLIPSEWSQLDNEGRRQAEPAAEFDKKVVAIFTGFMDRIDRLRTVTSLVRVTTVDQDGPKEYKEIFPTWFFSNPAGGQVGDVARAVTGYNSFTPPDPDAPALDAKGFVGWLDKHNPIGPGQTVSANPMDVIYTGLSRAGVSFVINTLVDWGFVKREYIKIITQVRFDFGNRMAEQVDIQEKFLADLEARLNPVLEALESAHRVSATLPHRPPVPNPRKPPVVDDPKKRPAGRQGFVAFGIQHAAQAGGLYGVMWGASELFNQSPTGLVVVGAVSAAIMGTFPNKYLSRRNDQNEVDKTIFRGRDRERPIENLTSKALLNLAIKYGEREIEAAATGTTARNPTPPRTKPPEDATNPVNIDEFVAAERAVLENDPRPVELTGPRLLALDRMSRIANRVRVFAEHAKKPDGNDKPLLRAQKDMKALYEAYSTMLDDTAETYGTPMPDDHEVLLNDAAERKEQRKPPGFRGGTPGIRPAGDLQSYVDTSVRTPAGRAYYAHDDDVLEEVADVRPEPGWYTVDMHGSPDSVRIGDEELTAEDFASLMVLDPTWHGQPIRLLACETGKRADGFAQQVADLLGVRVLAPTEHAAMLPNGEVIATVTKETWDGEVRPVLPPTGRLYIFDPTVPPDPEPPAVPPAPEPPTRGGLAWPHYEEVRIGEVRKMELVPEIGELALLRSGPTVYTGAERLWPDELANLVAESGDWTGGPARIQVREGQVDPEFVQRFADMLGVPVLINASAVTGDFATLSSGTLEVYNEPSPVEKPAGAWRVYEPRNVTAGRDTP